MNLKILIAGGTCSGKSTLACHITEHTGYSSISFGSILRKYSSENGLPLSVEALQELCKNLIDRLGYEKFLRWMIEHSPHVRWDEALIIDGVRHTSMYDSINRMFPTNVLVYCVCDKETQLIRLINRNRLPRKDVERIISHSLEKFIIEFEQHAHLFFRLGDSIESFLTQLDVLIAKLQ